MKAPKARRRPPRDRRHAQTRIQEAPQLAFDELGSDGAEAPLVVHDAALETAVASLYALDLEAEAANARLAAKDAEVRELIAAIEAAAPVSVCGVGARPFRVGAYVVTAGPRPRRDRAQRLVEGVSAPLPELTEPPRLAAPTAREIVVEVADAA